MASLTGNGTIDGIPHCDQTAVYRNDTSSYILYGISLVHIQTTYLAVHTTGILSIRLHSCYHVAGFQYRTLRETNAEHYNWLQYIATYTAIYRVGKEGGHYGHYTRDSTVEG